MGLVTKKTLKCANFLLIHGLLKILAYVMHSSSHPISIFCLSDPPSPNTTINVNKLKKGIPFLLIQKIVYMISMIAFSCQMADIILAALGRLLS